jgi:hypothetical protein
LSSAVAQARVHNRIGEDIRAGVITAYALTLDAELRHGNALVPIEPKAFDPLTQKQPGVRLWYTA